MDRLALAKASAGIRCASSTLTGVFDTAKVALRATLRKADDRNMAIELMQGEFTARLSPARH
jgi:hypothetical protein